MNSRFILNLLLGVLVAGLALVIALEPGIEQPGEPPSLAGADRGAVTTISIERREGEALALERRGEDWFVLTRHTMPASSFQVRSLLDLLSAGIERSYSAEGLQRGKLGLDPPLARIRFQPGPVILFGEKEPLAGLRYVELDGQVHLIADHYGHLVDSAFTEFVDRRLLPRDTPITLLALPDRTLRHTDAVHWTVSPEDTSVSADSIQEMVDAWQQTTALWVRSAEATDSTETVRIELDGESDAVDFVVVSREPEWVLARPEWGIQYHLTEEAGRKLFELADALPSSTAP